MATKTHQPPRGVQTEIDIVRHIVKDLIESYSEEKDATAKRFQPLRTQSVDRTPEENLAIHEQKKAIFKLYMRIWITCVRQVRN
jgi:hypothetical protein